MSRVSSKILKLYQRIAHWDRGLGESTACWVAEENGIKFTEAEKDKLQEAAKLYWKARDLFNEVYEPKIGKLVAEDLRAGRRFK